MQEVGAPPRTERDAPPLQCWHTRKSGMPELPLSLHVCITPAASNTSASQVCQPPDLCLLLLHWEMPFLCFILQREGKRKAEEGGIKPLVLWDVVSVLPRSLMGSPPPCKRPNFSQTYKMTVVAPWFS